MTNILPFSDNLIKSEGLNSPLIDNEENNDSICKNYNLGLVMTNLTNNIKKLINLVLCIPNENLEKSDDYQSLNFEENEKN